MFWQSVFRQLVLLAICISAIVLLAISNLSIGQLAISILAMNVNWQRIYTSSIAKSKLYKDIASQPDMFLILLIMDAPTSDYNIIQTLPGLSKVSKRQTLEVA